MSELAEEMAASTPWSVEEMRKAIATLRDIPAREGDYICICHPSVVYGKNWRAKFRRRGRMRRAWLRYYCREAHRMRHLVDGSDITERILGWAYVNGYFRRGVLDRELCFGWGEEVKKFEGRGL